MAPSKSLIFAKIPDGEPVMGEHMTIETRDVDISTAPAGGLAVEVLYMSLDPYQRRRMRDPSIKSYVPAFQVGKPVASWTVSRVLRSDLPGYAEGDLVRAMTDMAQYARIEGPMIAKTATKVDNSLGLDLGCFLGPLGIAGQTAWSGLYEIGKPKRGETIFVSSAAGAVGQIVGQVAKREGLTVIGSVGSDDKLDFITRELGFDAGFNYKKEAPIDALRRLAPNGIDIYFDNVGADHLEAAIEVMNFQGRIVACGMISEYNKPLSECKGVSNLRYIVSKSITMRGYIYTDPDFGPAYEERLLASLPKWLSDGSVKAKLDITNGIENAGDAFIGMLRGQNYGKAMVKVTA
ncbi:hypothetical protein HIM_05623 [Hirsutella minnesotensis 3608]|uniref:Dehydrogenase FUB6 n=1 Tax=Hirsutella minnesotensis 3608 TaxID=1043627 RepID=A0A0F8A080_9HYPO|nr:hypothetical protein HIM_05623 [Hirsutella minnesotensis 3608]